MLVQCDILHWLIGMTIETYMLVVCMRHTSQIIPVYHCKKRLFVLTIEWLPGCRQAEEAVVMISLLLIFCNCISNLSPNCTL